MLTFSTDLTGVPEASLDGYRKTHERFHLSQYHFNFYPCILQICAPCPSRPSCKCNGATTTERPDTAQ